MQRTAESFLMKNGEKGLTFYSDKEPKDLTARASYYKRNITTQKVLVIDNAFGDKEEPTVRYLTKTTIL